MNRHGRRRLHGARLLPDPKVVAQLDDSERCHFVTSRRRERVREHHRPRAARHLDPVQEVQRAVGEIERIRGRHCVADTGNVIKAGETSLTECL